MVSITGCGRVMCEAFRAARAPTRSVVAARTAVFGGMLCGALTWSGRAHAGTATLGANCTLAQAVTAINQHVSRSGCGFVADSGADTIVVPNGTFISTSQVEVNRAVTIRGNGSGVSTLRGDIASDYYFIRVVDPSGSNYFNATIQGVNIERVTGGQTTAGVYAQNVGLSINQARIAGFGFGGVGADDADVTITDTTIENNTSVGNGGGIWFQNGLCSIRNTVLLVYRSTIANNGAALSGGGIYYAGCGVSKLFNTTISHNSATNGGGVTEGSGGEYLFSYGSTIAFNSAWSSGGGVQVDAFGIKLEGSIVGQNSAPSGPDISGSINDFTDSIIGDVSGTVNWNNPNIRSGVSLVVSPNLDSTLRDLGGPFHTKVHRPLPGSPALDAVSGTPSWADGGVDQRQVLRPQLGGSNAGSSDIGAFESSRLETETLAVAAKSNVNHVVVTSTQASAGKGTNLQANAVGQFVTYSSGAALPAGNYGLKVGFKKGSSAGQFQLTIGPSASGPWVTLPVQNARASSDSWTTVDLGNITAGTTSTKYFRFIVPSGATTPVQIFPDFVELTRH